MDDCVIDQSLFLSEGHRADISFTIHFQLDIVQQNYVSSATLKRPLVFTEVEQVAFSEDSDWLATVERRDDEITAVEMRLKFWFFDQKTQGYGENNF